MSRHAGSFTAGVLAGAVYLAGSFSFSPAAPAEPPNFAPNPNIGWYSYKREFIPPSSGPGPVQQDPSRPHVTNDEYRVTGRQPTQPLPWQSEYYQSRSGNLIVTVFPKA